MWETSTRLKRNVNTCCDLTTSSIIMKSHIIKGNNILYQLKNIKNYHLLFKKKYTIAYATWIIYHIYNLLLFLLFINSITAFIGSSLNQRSDKACVSFLFAFSKFSNSNLLISSLETLIEPMGSFVNSSTLVHILLSSSSVLNISETKPYRNASGADNL